jgi:isopenicillin N synthase-like dioxygenase
VGFFYVTHHGVSEELQQKLMDLSREFFALPVEEKLEINMEQGTLFIYFYYKTVEGAELYNSVLLAHSILVREKSELISYLPQSENPFFSHPFFLLLKMELFPYLS